MTKSKTKTIDGVQVRESSLRITFSFEGRQYHKRLMVGDQAMPPTSANIKHAARLVAEIKARIKAGIFVMAEYFPEESAGAGELTLSGQLDKALAVLRIEDSTRGGYKSAAKFWKTAPADAKNTPLGTLRLRDVRPTALMFALASRPHLSGKTINNYVSVLREALELAVADKLLPDNPAEQLKRADHQKPPPDPFTPEEREAIIAHFAKHHAGQAANLVEFWMWTGLRTSEIFGLRWDSVDLASGTVLVSEANVRGKQKTSTKTNIARVVRLNSRALAAIQRQRAHTQLAGEHVFKHPAYDTPWGDERAWRRSFWHPTLKKLGYRYRRPYQMRHTYATAMLMAGMTPAFCAKQLGHSVEMFLRTYSKWIDGAASDLEMRRLEASFMPTLCQSEAGKEKTR